MKKAKKTKSN